LTRGNPSFNPKGSVSHWTAGARTGDRGSLQVCINGRPGIPGPLCNTFLPRSKVVVVVACGRANHAGTGGVGGLVGNSSVFGTEAECSGGGEWTEFQRWAYPRINAAYCDLGASPAHIYGHHEWAPTRKIDIRDWPMSLMREQVRALLSGGDPTQEDERMTPEDLDAIEVRMAEVLRGNIGDIAMADPKSWWHQAIVPMMRKIVAEEVTKVSVTQGFAGAADTGRMVAALGPTLAASLAAADNGVSDEDVRRFAEAVNRMDPDEFISALAERLRTDGV
jgi:hypothetical protein